MAKPNQYSELLRSIEPSTETKLRGDDKVIAPYENGVAALDDLIEKLDSDIGDSAMNELRKLILRGSDIPASVFAKYNELLVKDLLHVKRRLETANANYRNRQPGTVAKETTKA